MQEDTKKTSSLSLDSLVADEFDFLREIGPSGLVFVSATPMKPGDSIQLRLPRECPVLETTGLVSSCRPEKGHFAIGVDFADKVDRFQARMVQQVCHIEHYRKELREREGRDLSRQEAALEWIRKFAHDFPALEEFPRE